MNAHKDLFSDGLVHSQEVVHTQDPLLLDPLSLEVNTTMKEGDGIPPGKTLKKPDKLLPCPRCESLDTKFCYFNNYNVNQPRHFCRKCQRYWTAGGMLRNVPVGAGRRKNKHSHSHSASHDKNNGVDTVFVRGDASDMAHQRCSVTAMPTTQHKHSNAPKVRGRASSLDSVSGPSLDSPSITVGYTPCFGQESPACAPTTLGASVTAESANAFLDIDERKETKMLWEKAQPVVRSHMSINQASQHEKSCSMLTPAQCGGESEEVECQSNDDVEQLKHLDAAFMSQNHGSNNGVFNHGPLQVPNFWPGSAPSGGLWTNIPWPLMNPMMWSPPPVGWVNGWNVPYGVEKAWNMSYGVENGMPKQHKLEECTQPNGSLWAPKTLRIADPVDAARSSIWSTLGLGGPSSTTSPSFAATSKPFQVKSEGDSVNQKPHANPAASSRSAAFNENS